VLLYDVESLAACARLGAETATAHLPAILAFFNDRQP
jgi:hypothetical protein